MATQKASKLDSLEKFHPKSRKEWRAWLEKYHRTSSLVHAPRAHERVVQGEQGPEAA